MIKRGFSALVAPCGYRYNTNLRAWSLIMNLKLDLWIILGLIGQFAFMGRFLLQWIASERVGKSIIPIHFWYLSIVGSLILLIYAIHRQDPIFILGYSGNSLIYVRNLILIYKEKNSLPPNQSL